MLFTARIAAVKPTGNPIICKTDEVGELVIQSPATGSGYWGLSGKTTTTFKVVRLISINHMVQNFDGVNFDVSFY